MRNGVRHLLGAGTGLLATPLIAAGFLYYASLGGGWVAVGVLAATMVVAGLLAGSRISPIASLVPGLVLAGLAAAALARVPGVVAPALMPAGYARAYAELAETWALVAGCVLLAASAFPSRWRAAVRAEPPQPPEEEAPADPPPPPLPRRIPSRY
ncbi:hypothetical protein ACBJ59_51710 [Nonomuraea sp. MTCD27]|uniref:hypothetical protein n=1 Tax=Nonomuraea sp. MTCD27 TaxID=1676747 RepID=UPI0035C0C17C